MDGWNNQEPAPWMGNRGSEIRRESRASGHAESAPSEFKKRNCKGFPCLFSLWVYLSAQRIPPAIYELLGYPNRESPAIGSLISPQIRNRIPPVIA